MLPSRWDLFKEPFVGRSKKSFTAYDTSGAYGRTQRVNVGDIVLVLDVVDGNGYDFKHDESCRVVISVRERVLYMHVQKRWNPSNRFEEP